MHIRKVGVLASILGFLVLLVKKETQVQVEQWEIFAGVLAPILGFFVLLVKKKKQVQVEQWRYLPFLLPSIMWWRSLPSLDCLVLSEGACYMWWEGDMISYHECSGSISYIYAPQGHQLGKKIFRLPYEICFVFTFPRNFGCSGHASWLLAIKCNSIMIIYLILPVIAVTCT